jgi:hypothetical protein
MPPVRFKPTISAGEQPQTYALDRAATGTGMINISLIIIIIIINNNNNNFYSKINFYMFWKRVNERNGQLKWAIVQ